MEPALLVAVCVVTTVATAVYRHFALRLGILATASSRTLHTGVVPRGGGVIFGLVFATGILILWTRGVVPTFLMLALGVGGVGAVSAGFIDDVYGIRVAPKLGLHIALSVWLVVSLYEPLFDSFLSGLTTIWRIGVLLALVFVPVWLINLYNFIDGIDGMAILGAIFVCAAAILLLFLKGAGSGFVVLFALLGLSVAGFAPFNLPPARVFIGDAGSIFLGYCFACLMFATIHAGAVNTWSWISLFAYFIGDTTTTTAVRVVLIRRWYRVHRSHAYQNLARMYKSHAKVTYGVMAYHVLWALPMAIYAALRPESAPLAATLAVVPVVAWALRFGPLFSSD